MTAKVVPIRVLIADDHELFRRGLHEALGRFEGIEIVGEAGTGRVAVEQTLALRPDVVLMDVRMPDQTGIDATKAILEACSAVRVVILTVFEDMDALRNAIAAGAVGYMLKDTGIESLAAAIRAVHRGEIMIGSELARQLLKGNPPESPGTSRREDGLTDREIRILSEVARGLGDKEIAAKMFLSESTIKSHLRNVYRRLKVQNRAQATAYALQNGLLAQHGLTVPATNGSEK